VRVLDLFSGIGGFSLGLERAGMTTVAFCEINPFCRRDDIRRLHMPRGSADVVCGGFPCQPFSTASRGRKVAEDLWPEMRRVIEGVRPLWVIAENVDSIDDERPAQELEKLDFSVWSVEVDASPRGRRHERRRALFVAHANADREPRRAQHAQVAVAQSHPRRGWQDNSAPVGVDDGLPGRMDRMRALGNSFCPLVAEGVGRAIMDWRKPSVQ
jgi:DNA (cytosine-5)-methyltransferase 1